MYLKFDFSVLQFKGFCVVYLQANRDFQKIITQTRKNIFMRFLHLVHLNKIFQNKLFRFLDLPDPPIPPVALLNTDQSTC